jgi:hypothetical protein
MLAPHPAMNADPRPPEWRMRAPSGSHSPARPPCRVTPPPLSPRAAPLRGWRPNLRLSLMRLVSSLCIRRSSPSLIQVPSHRKSHPPCTAPAAHFILVVLPQLFSPPNPPSPSPLPSLPACLLTTLLFPPQASSRPAMSRRCWLTLVQRRASSPSGRDRPSRPTCAQSCLGGSWSRSNRSSASLGSSAPVRDQAPILGSARVSVVFPKLHPSDPNHGPARPIDSPVARYLFLSSFQLASNFLSPFICLISVQAHAPSPAPRPPLYPACPPPSNRDLPPPLVL